VPAWLPHEDLRGPGSLPVAQSYSPAAPTVSAIAAPRAPSGLSRPTMGDGVGTDVDVIEVDGFLRALTVGVSPLP
jgi:hypothetical protein